MSKKAFDKIAEGLNEALAIARGTPVVRLVPLPNGRKIVSLRESTLRAGINAANSALKAERE